MTLRALSGFFLGTLRGRLIFGVAAVHAVMMALFIGDLTERQRAMLLERQTEEASALSQALATSAAGWIAANDVSGLQELVEAQRRHSEILFVILTDQQGHVLADSDKSRQGQYLLDLPREVRQTVLLATPALVDVAAPALVGGRQVGWARVGIGQKSAGEKLAEITRDGILYALAAILIGSFIAWFMGRRITRRLYAVQETFDAVRSGNRLARSKVSGGDEVAVLAHEFNAMLDAMAERDAELKERERYSQSLLRLSRNLEQSQTYAEVLDAARDEVRKIIGYQNLWAYLLTDDGKFFKALVAGGPTADTVMSEDGTATLVIEGDRMLAEIAVAKEIVLVADAQTDERVNKEIVARMGSRTIVNVPILLFDRHLGSVGMGTFGDEGVRVPTQSEQEYLIALASHMAVTLDRIHLLAERKRNEAALREGDKRYKQLLDSVTDYIYTVQVRDGRGIATVHGPGCLRVTGYTPEEYAADPDLWYRMVHEPDRAAVMAQAASILAGGEVAPLEHRIRHRDGSLRWVRNTSVPRYDQQRRVLAYDGLIADITERKQAEEEIREFNQELERRVAERTAEMEAANKELEAFAFSVSHDLRAPLRHIDGFVELLRERAEPTLDAEGRRYMDTISKSARRMGVLIDDLLSFSRMGRAEMARIQVDLTALVRDAIRDFEAETHERAIDWRIAALPVVTGDRAMLRVVLDNLISNALKFTRPRAQAQIEIGCEVKPDGETILFVRDNGVGFDMRYVDKLFGVFQRLHTADEFEGTGIGLANVRRVINRHGGRTWAEGAVDRGATFYFSLPRTV